MPNRNEFNILESVVAMEPCTRVKPGEFFISWNAVPTLAYQGFSPVLLEIKSEIERAIPGLKAENPGAKWPKTTLGALRDDRRLSMEDARTLRDVCDDFRNQTESEAHLSISDLCVVVFACRSLERRLLTHRIPLRPDQPWTAHDPPQDHLVAVRSTMEQFSRARLNEYLPKLQAPGNRDSHYRSTHVEATLVFDLGNQQPESIDRFIEEVDRRLPGFYCWFAPESRHMTVRGLV